ncbi:MAG TPA: SDR family oxidoreductase [Acetobacteraceae bacterium]|nr:SDR family oxidoreductase [Acetobacteraceae bacterium]
MTPERVLVLGAGGMLGTALVRELAQAGVVVIAAARRPLAGLPAGVTQAAPGDLRDAAALSRLVAEAAPDVVVNAAGLIKQRPEAEDPAAAIETNALLPHRLAALCAARDARLIHVSTDCVFSGSTEGRRGPAGYRETDPPDPTDLYGRSKLLGETTGPHCLTLRMSLIGREAAGTRHGLVEWFLAAPGPVRGYARALFSGLTTPVAARLVLSILRDYPRLHGLWHAAAEPISKLDLLRAMRDRAKPGLGIEAVDGPAIDRRLDGTALHAATGWSAPAWEAMLDELLGAPGQEAAVRGRA